MAQGMWQARSPTLEVGAPQTMRGRQHRCVSVQGEATSEMPASDQRLVLHHLNCPLLAYEHVVRP